MSERVQLSVRVPEDIKNSYEDQIHKKYGVKRPYAGIELEKELRVNLDMGQESGMFDSLRELVDNPSEKKENETPTFTGGESIVQYRIHTDVRAKLKELSYDAFGSMGSIVAKAMYRYSIGRGYQDRMLEYVQDLEEDDVQDDDLSATERKERDIAEYLKENHGDGVLSFKTEHFDKAAKEAADLFTESHAREKYLKDVLERLEVKPTSSGKFLPEDTAAIRDPRGLPYEAMDRSDKITALRAELLERDEGAILTTDKEAGTSPVPTINPVEVLGKRPRELDSILTEVAEAPGFRFKPTDPGRFDSLSVRLVSITAAKEDVNSDDKAFEVAGLLENPEPESDDVQEGAQNDYAEATTQRAEAIAD